MLARFLMTLLVFASVASAENLEQAVDGYLSAQDPTRLENWTITGQFGVTFTDGNSETTTLTAGIDAETTWAPWKLMLKLRSIYAESSSVETANEHILTERLERQLSEIEWLFQDLWLEHDEQERLTYRIQFTLGYKRRLMKKPNFELFGEAGGGVLHEEFRPNITDTEGIAQFGVNWTWQITKTLHYTQIITFYPSLSNGGEFRMYWESVFTTPVSDRIDARLTIIDKYDSDAPLGVKKNDIVVTLTMAVKFTKAK